MLRRQIRAGAVSVLLTAAVLGCGSSDPPPKLSAGAASQMRTHLAAVRSSATAGDRAQATRALDAFAAEVARQKAAGQLSDATSAGLERVISRTRERIAAEVVAPAPAAPPSLAQPSPAPPPAEDEDDDEGEGDEGKGKGKGNGRGKGR